MDTYNKILIHQTLFSSEFGMWLWENQNDLVYFNKTYLEMLGYVHNAFPFHISTFYKLIHPEDQDRVMQKQRRILEDPSLGNSFEDKFRLLRASGEYMWILDRGFVLCRDENGKALRVTGMHIDAKLLEQESKNMDIQHDRMVFALEASNDGLWDWNPQTNEVYYSPRYYSMLGYTSQSFPPSLEAWRKKIHPDDVDATCNPQQALVNSPAHGDTFDCIYRCLDVKGEYRWILGRGKVTKRDENGKALRVVGLHTDVTDLRNAQAALERQLHHDTLTHLYSRYYFDSLLNKINERDYPLSILFCDLDGLKIVNDILGHTDGDKMLILAANILRKSLPLNGIPARLGGDEFAVLLCRTPEEEANEVAASILKELESYNEASHVLPVFMSIGVVTSQSTTPSHKLLSRADEAMLRNKKIQRTLKRRILITRIEEITGQKIDFTDSRLIYPDQDDD